MPKSKFKWPLNDSHFTWLDRVRLCQFVLDTRNRWTMGARVKQYEAAWARYAGVRYACMVSSGSAANTLIAQQVRDAQPPRGANQIVLPAVTWQTAVSPWLRAGFEPVFLDVSLHDFALDADALEIYLQKNASRVACVFPTSLLGFTPDITRFVQICRNYGVPLRVDNCENSFGAYRGRHVCAGTTCSVSNYFGHQTTTGGESGLILTDDEDLFVYFLLNRNHGMVRSLDAYREQLHETDLAGFRNPTVDPRFDFCCLGNNHRNTDLMAYLGLLDFARVKHYVQRRLELYEQFRSSLDGERFYLPPQRPQFVDVPFALPIIARGPGARSRRDRAIARCTDLGIETRPLVGGNLLRQACYRPYGEPEDFPVAESLHHNGFYVGLFPRLREFNVARLAQTLNGVR